MSEKKESRALALPKGFDVNDYQFFTRQKANYYIQARKKYERNNGEKKDLPKWTEAKALIEPSNELIHAVAQFVVGLDKEIVFEERKFNVELHIERAGLIMRHLANILSDLGVGMGDVLRKDLMRLLNETRADRRD